MPIIILFKIAQFIKRAIYNQIRHYYITKYAGRNEQV